LTAIGVPSPLLWFYRPGRDGNITFEIGRKEGRLCRDTTAYRAYATALSKGHPSSEGGRIPVALQPCSPRRITPRGAKLSKRAIGRRADREPVPEPHRALRIRGGTRAGCSFTSALTQQDAFREALVQITLHLIEVDDDRRPEIREIVILFLARN